MDDGRGTLWQKIDMGRSQAMCTERAISGRQQVIYGACTGVCESCNIGLIPGRQAR